MAVRDRCRRLAAVGMALLTIGAAGCAKSGELRDLSPDEAKALALDAYIFGYPLVTMEMTRQVATNVARPTGEHAPAGQLARLREYPQASFRDVTAPNADTLYTTSFIDVGKEPQILSIPDFDGRYALFPMLDAWTNVFQDPGERTTGTGPQTYAITGPGWRGALPPGVVEYKSPTALVWMLGRIYCDGTPQDYAVVHRLQDAISLAPLSSYGKPYAPPLGKADPAVDMKTPVRDQVNALRVEEYFNLLARLLKDNPPAEADAPAMAKLARIGVKPGEAFHLGALGPDAASALRSVPKDAVNRIMGAFGQTGRNVNGWNIRASGVGTYGTDYLQRALVTAIGLGANLPEDAIYPVSRTDADGEAYNGANRYVLRFDKGQLPPVDGFWSLTMYDDKYFFVENPLHRQRLGQHDPLVPNPDGSVDLYAQRESPGSGREANWLPAPSGKFVLMLRLFWPKRTPPSILDGTWKPPAAVKAG